VVSRPKDVFFGRKDPLFKVLAPNVHKTIAHTFTFHKERMWYDHNHVMIYLNLVDKSTNYDHEDLNRHIKMFTYKDIEL